MAQLALKQCRMLQLCLGQEYALPFQNTAGWLWLFPVPALYCQKPIVKVFACDEERGERENVQTWTRTTTLYPVELGNIYGARLLRSGIGRKQSHFR
jgi:hypothetical protein